MNIFFDLDGTLIDSEEDIRAAWLGAIAERGLSCPDFNRIFRVGPALHVMLGRLFPGLGGTGRDALLAAFKRRYDDAALTATRPYPGIGAWLERLRRSGARLMVVTNKRAKPTDMLLGRFRWLPLFSKVYTSDFFGAPRPKAAILRHAAAENADGERPVMAGDTEEDIRAGRAAGCETWACSWGYGDRNALAALAPDRILSLDTLGDAGART